MNRLIHLVLLPILWVLRTMGLNRAHHKVAAVATRAYCRAQLGRSYPHWHILIPGVAIVLGFGLGMTVLFKSEHTPRLWPEQRACYVDSMKEPTWFFVVEGVSPPRIQQVHKGDGEEWNYRKRRFSNGNRDGCRLMLPEEGGQ